MNSLWLCDDFKNKKFESLNNDVFCDVCIIGAGIFGLTCAYYLSKLGFKVIVVDKSDISRKTTGHTTAKITSQHGLFYTYLVDTYGNQFAKDYLFANEEAIENIKNIVNVEHINCDFESQSNFVYTTDISEVDKLKKEVDYINSIGFPANFVTKCGLPFHIAGGVQFKNQAQFNPIKYVNGLCNCIVRNNGQIYTNSTVYDVKKNSDLFSTSTVGGSIKSKYVVLASHYPFVNFPGMYFFKMYQSSSYVIGVDTKKTLFNGMYISSSNPIYSFRTAFYQGKKILLLGGSGHKTGTSVTNEGSYLALENYAKELYPNCDVLFRWSTRDCITLDKIPYIGLFSNTLDNFFVGTGFNKWGMTSSNVAANIVCDFILGKTNRFAYVFDSTRVKPVKNRTEVKNMISESVNSLALKKLKDSNVYFDSIPYNSGGIIDVNNQKVGVYKDTSGNIFAVKPVCTHLGCLLSWNDADKTWDCPCHGSRFDFMGKNLYDPAFKDLEIFDLDF